MLAIESKISKLRALTDELNRRDEEIILFKEFLDFLPLGVYVVDATTKRTFYANKMMIEILGRQIMPGISIEKMPEIEQSKIYHHGTNRLYQIEELPIIKALNGKETPHELMDIEVNGERIEICTCAGPVKNEYGFVSFAISTFHILRCQNGK